MELKEPGNEGKPDGWGQANYPYPPGSAFIECDEMKCVGCGFCQMACSIHHFGVINRELFLNAACGWDLTDEDVSDIALRNFYFNRCISPREGYNPTRDDYLPQRAFDEPITDKYGTTWVWDRDEFEREKRRHYTQVLKLTRDGLPPVDGLERLGLGFIIPVLGLNQQDKKE
jgi:aldehyde:ferredoxin oxidoreductase